MAIHWPDLLRLPTQSTENCAQHFDGANIGMGNILNMYQTWRGSPVGNKPSHASSIPLQNTLLCQPTSLHQHTFQTNHAISYFIINLTNMGGKLSSFQIPGSNRCASECLTDIEWRTSINEPTNVALLITDSTSHLHHLAKSSHLASFHFTSL